MNEPLYYPGLEGIIAGETAICTIDGGLFYRGYAIEDLAEQTSFEEVAYLLLHGELPNEEQLAAFRARLLEHMCLPGDVSTFIRHAPATTPPMDLLRTVVSALAHWDPKSQDNAHESNVAKAERLMAQISTAIASMHRMWEGHEVVAPDDSLSFAGNFLWMLWAKRPSEIAIKAMEVSLILYAEHEFNASTFTARVVASTLGDLHSAVTAAIGALKGPLHGGANEQVMAVLEDVGDETRAEAWVRERLAKKERIMGFGHRVYKLGDPRAAYLKPFCQQLAEEQGEESLERRAEVIEQILATEKRLAPNLDWPSARLYYYLGLPVPIYTPLFVASRITGWSAHVMEQLEHNRLIRPRSRYIGPSPRSIVPLKDRR